MRHPFYIPNLPSRFSELYRKYKEKNQLNNVDLIKRINELIADPQDQILTKVNNYGKEEASSAFNSFLSESKEPLLEAKRPKNVSQRVAMARLLNVHYIDTIFSNEFEIRSYFERCYNYAYEALLEINKKQSLFISASIATRNSIKEKLIEAKNIDARAIASFVYHFFTFLCGFDISISPTNALYGYLSPIDLSKSTLIVSLGEAS